MIILKEISGTMYSYSYLCDRKLWLYSKDIVMEQESEYVSMGKIIDEESYKRDKKHLYLDDLVCIDIVRQNVICEVKKSSSQKQMAIHQLKYYLYLLKKKGIKASGELLIPEENVKEKINFEDDDVKNIERQLNRISEICSQQSPPEIINKKICKKCAYFELCYI